MNSYCYVFSIYSEEEPNLMYVNISKDLDKQLKNVFRKYKIYKQFQNPNEKQRVFYLLDNYPIESIKIKNLKTTTEENKKKDLNSVKRDLKYNQNITLIDLDFNKQPKVCKTVIQNKKNNNFISESVSESESESEIESELESETNKYCNKLFDNNNKKECKKDYIDDWNNKLFKQW